MAQASFKSKWLLCILDLDVQSVCWGLLSELSSALSLVQRVTDAEAQLSDEQAKTMRLEVALAESQQKLGKMEELEKELEHHR